jgi:hypothetical protein
MHTGSRDDRGANSHRPPPFTLAEKGTGRVSVTPNDYVCAPDLVAAAREFIRREGGGVVSICQLLDEMCDMLGDRFPVSPNTYKVLDLIETLWADPHVNQVPHGSIEFAWSEKGFDQVPATGLKAMLLVRFQIPPATVEEA